MVLFALSALSDAAPIGPIVKSVRNAVELFDQFMKSLKPQYGSGPQFLEKYDIPIQDIYKSRLQLEALNTFQNKQQTEAEEEQNKLIQEDMASEHVDAMTLTTLVVIITIIQLTFVVLKIVKMSQRRGKAKKEKVIAQYEMELEYKELKESGERKMRVTGKRLSILRIIRNYLNINSSNQA